MYGQYCDLDLTPFLPIHLEGYDDDFNPENSMEPVSGIQVTRDCKDGRGKWICRKPESIYKPLMAKGYLENESAWEDGTVNWELIRAAG